MCVIEREREGVNLLLFSSLEIIKRYEKRPGMDIFFKNRCLFDLEI